VLGVITTSGRRQPRRRGSDRRRTVVVALLAAAVLGACADDGPIAVSGAPISVDTTEAGTPGDQLVGAPVPDDVEAFAPPSVTGDTTAQSFRVVGSTPRQAIEDYVSLATDQGWEVQDPPAPTGETDWAATLVHGDSSLLATTAPAEPDSPDAQLSLELTALD
jgi:hypothetical protein